MFISVCTLRSSVKLNTYHSASHHQTTQGFESVEPLSEAALEIMHLRHVKLRLMKCMDQKNQLAVLAAFI